MSKTQEKRARRKAEQEAFILERRKMQLAVFQNNFEIGLKLFETNRSSLPEEEVKLIEQEIESTRQAIEEFKKANGLTDTE